MKLRFALLCATLLMASMVLVFPQTQGTISGVVKDPTGAVIPGAEVVLTNVDTGAKRTVVSDDAGFYNATNVEVGTYTVSVTMPGFKTATSDPTKVDARSNRVINITLQVGDVSEQVTVEGASMAQVELRSGEVSNLIDGKQVTELPLNGRSFVQLALLVPGASPLETANVRYTGLFAGVDISFSGSSQNSNMWLVDGTNNVDIGSGRTIMVYPSVDSIQEFKIQRNSYSADMGASSGAQINVVTKSGTNEFHGSLYNFHRNAALNATDYLLNEASQPKQALVYNDFGYTVGGPIAKDKAFFFWSQEWRREGRGDSRSATVPTVLEKSGDFSGPNSRDYPDPIDYVTGLPFPGNKIPSDRLSPFAKAFMKLYPDPTRTTADGTNNWVAAPKTPINTRQEQIRGDWNINEKHSLMGRLTKDTWVNGAPSYTKGGLWGDDPFPAVDSNWDQPGHAVTAQWTASFGSGTVNQVQWSWSGNEIWITRGNGVAGQDAEAINKAIVDAIPEVFPGPDASYFANGPEHISESRAHPTFWGDMLGNTIWHQPPWQNEQDLWVWRDDFSKVMGDHSFKLGFLYSRNSKNEDVDGNGSAFSPAFWTNGGQAIAGSGGGGWGPANAPGRAGIVTGNGVADFLLKGTYWGGGTEHKTNVRTMTRWRDYETYFADTWRMTPRVTLNYGMRWAYLPNPYSANNTIGNFVLSLYKASEGATATNGLINPGNVRGLDVNPDSLVRNHWRDFAPRLGIAWDPTGKGKWAIRLGGGVYFNREAISEVMHMSGNPPMQTTIVYSCCRPFDALPTDDTFSGGAGVAGFGKAIEGDTPGSYQWNLTIERELWKDTKLELGYVANRGHNMQGRYNINQVPVADRTKFAIAEMDTGPGSGDTDGSNLRPLFPLKGDTTLYVASRAFDSWYQSFQAYLVKRFSSNVSYQISYTFSKLLTDGYGLGYYQDSTASDPTNMAYDKGLARFDRPHIFSGNLIYKTPAMAGAHPFVRTLLGEWETSTIVTMNSGVPQRITCCSGFTGTESNRPDLIADPEGPKTRFKWFNTAAFRPPSVVGQLGKSALAQYRGPGINNWDMSFMKNFSGLPWWNNEGATLQLRAELYNAFNHTQFKSVDNGFDIGQVVIDSAGKVTSYNQNNPSYGRISAFREPREIQVALKILW